MEQNTAALILDNKPDTRAETYPFAAAIYTPKTQDRSALNVFAREMAAAGVRVGGLVQEVLRDDDGRLRGMNAVDVETGARAPIKAPLPDKPQGEVCLLDTAALTDTSAVLRRNIADRLDLIIVEKFGDQEQRGAGLSDEIFAAIADGIPLLIAVPQSAREVWYERTGSMGETLEFEVAAFHRWWERVSG